MFTRRPPRTPPGNAGTPPNEEARHAIREAVAQGAFLVGGSPRRYPGDDDDLRAQQREFNDRIARWEHTTGVTLNPRGVVVVDAACAVSEAPQQRVFDGYAELVTHLSEIHREALEQAAQHVTRQVVGPVDDTVSTLAGVDELLCELHLGDNARLYLFTCWLVHASWTGADYRHPGRITEARLNHLDVVWLPQASISLTPCGTGSWGLSCGDIRATLSRPDFATVTGALTGLAHLRWRST